MDLGAISSSTYNHILVYSFTLARFLGFHFYEYHIASEAKIILVVKKIIEKAFFLGMLLIQSHVRVSINFFHVILRLLWQTVLKIIIMAKL